MLDEKKIGNLNRGRKFSPETIERMREKALIRPPNPPRPDPSGVKEKAGQDG